MSWSDQYVARAQAAGLPRPAEKVEDDGEGFVAIGERAGAWSPGTVERRAPQDRRHISNEGGVRVTGLSRAHATGARGVARLPRER
jgi:hypothetical protein